MNDVREVSATTFQRDIGNVLDGVSRNRGTVCVTSHGRPQVYIVSVEMYEELCEARTQLGLRHGIWPAKAPVVQ